MLGHSKKFEKFRLWEKAVPITPRNQILSSEYGNQGNAFHFHPSYNCEGKPDIKKLLNMEYARVWQVEKEQFDAIKSTVVQHDTRSKRFRQLKDEEAKERKEKDKIERKVKASLIMSKRKEIEKEILKQNELKRQEVLQRRLNAKKEIERIKENKMKYERIRLEVTKKPEKLLKITQGEKQRLKVKENEMKPEEVKEEEKMEEESCSCGEEGDVCQEDCITENCSGKTESCSSEDENEIALERKV